MAPTECSSGVLSARAMGPLGPQTYVAPAGCGTQWTQATAEGLTRAGHLPRPPSLVFDIELEDGGVRAPGCEEEQVGTKELKRWLLPGSTGEFKLRNDVDQGLSQRDCAAQTALEGNQRLASFLSRLGYQVSIRTAIGGGDGFECLRNLRHVFLAVSPPGAACTTARFVVDLSFKEQFRIAKPTPRYQMLLACLPEVFVAPEASVAPLVNFLCQEMAMAFRATGVIIPPWRQPCSMLSKWLPRKSLDEQVPRSIPTGGNGMPAIQSAGLAPRRSMDVAPAAVVHGHWVQTPGQHLQKAAPGGFSASQQQARAKLQQAEGLLGMDAPVPARRASSILVKPIVCEPKLKLVGGNFSSIGF